jgi:predicted  nucleic acid-binding Zn-ribbon protein
MTEQTDKVTEQGEALQKVDRVRDIIFGHQMRDYEQRFQLVQRDLRRLQQELDRLAEQLSDQQGDHTKKLQALRQDMRDADDAIREELRHIAQKLTDEKVDRFAFGELFIELGSHLKSGGSMIDLLKTLEPKIE